MHKWEDIQMDLKDEGDKERTAIVRLRIGTAGGLTWLRPFMFNEQWEKS